jgi:hypothetical protein
MRDEAKRIADARKAAAAELKVIDGQDREIGDPAVIRLSNARLYEAAITLRVLKGERIPASEIKASDDLIIAARNAVPKPMSLDLHIVETADTVACPQCSHEFEPAKVRRTLVEAQHAAQERMAKEKAVSAPAQSITAAVAGAASVHSRGTIADAAKMSRPNVVPLTAAERRKQALDAAPLARHRRSEPWDAFRAQIPAV